MKKVNSEKEPYEQIIPEQSHLVKYNFEKEHLNKGRSEKGKAETGQFRKRKSGK